MLNENGEEILFCNSGCSEENRLRCPTAYGINIEHIDEYDHEPENPDAVINASVYCQHFGGYEYFNLYTEAKHEL